MPNFASEKNLNSLWNTNIKNGSSPTACTAHMSNPVYLLWRNLVQHYSSCALTKAEDRLPAFSGVAKIFQEATGDEYLAGLWRSRFLDGLDWRVHDPRPDRTSSYRAPSWSWASVDGPLKPWIARAGAKHLVKVLDVKVTPRGSDVTGAIVSGTLTLQGVLTKARKIRLLGNGLVALSVADQSVAVRMYLDKSDYQISDGELFGCLPLNVERSDNGDGNHVVQVCVLALLVSPQGEYRRIRHFILEDTQSFGLFGLVHEGEVGSEESTASLGVARSKVVII